MGKAEPKILYTLKGQRLTLEQFQEQTGMTPEDYRASLPGGRLTAKRVLEFQQQHRERWGLRDGQ